MGKAVVDMKEYLDFRIMENHIISKGKKVYFYRFYPPNLSILTAKEKAVEIETLCNFLESMNLPLQIFAMDKVEDLSKNKDFFLHHMLEEYEQYTTQIAEQIASYESSDEQTNSIQRAYYFVMEEKNQEDKIIFEEALQVQRLKASLVLHEELITICRNFYLREFSNFDLYVFSEEVFQKYDH